MTKNSYKSKQEAKQAAAAEIEIIHHFVEESTQSSAMMNGSQILQCASEVARAVGQLPMRIAKFAVHHGAGLLAFFNEVMNFGDPNLQAESNP